METWNGIRLAEVRRCYIADTARGLFGTAAKLRFPKVPITHFALDKEANKGYVPPVEYTLYTFSTGVNGAVVVDGNYTRWTFVAPDGFSAARGSTVADFFASLRAASPVPAWEKFAAWFGESGAPGMNSFITEGGAVTVTGADGNTYAGAQRVCGSVTDFPEFLGWVESWCGEEFLAASDTAVYTSEKTASWSFSVTAMGVDAALTFTFRL